MIRRTEAIVMYTNRLNRDLSAIVRRKLYDLEYLEVVSSCDFDEGKMLPNSSSMEFHRLAEGRRRPVSGTVCTKIEEVSDMLIQFEFRDSFFMGIHMKSFVHEFVMSLSMESRGPAITTKMLLLVLCKQCLMHKVSKSRPIFC